MEDTEASKPQEISSTGLTPEEIKQISNNTYNFIRSQPRESGILGETEYDPVSDMMLGLEEIPDILGKRFDAHGIAKGTIGDQVASLNKLLTTGIDEDRPFHSMPLKGADAAAAAFGASGPYAGSFIVLGEAGQPLRDKIRYVITNNPLENSLPLLSSRFPQVEFIPIKKAPQRLAEIVG